MDSFTKNDVIGILVDLKQFQLTFYKNKSKVGVDITLHQNAKYYPYVCITGSGCISLSVQNPPKQ